MKRVLNLIVVISLFLSSFLTSTPAQAAAGLYTFSVVSGVYDDIGDEIAYTAFDFGSDPDDGMASVALPFTFTYDDTGYNTAYISVNGLVGMNGFPANAYTNNLNGTYGQPLLAPLWDDLALNNGEGEIGYVTLGDAPNRVFVVQWQDLQWPLSNGTPQNFQVRLYETTHIIEFVYGTMSEPGGDPTASIGIVDAVGGSGHYLSVTPAAGTADTVSSTTANDSIHSAVHLTSGKTYIFTPLDPNAPPSCAMNLGPADGATDVLLNHALNWSSGGGQVDGYKLYFGIENPPTSIANGTDLGTATTFQPSGNLDSNTTYYWQIMPYNANGGATGCPVWSFTTGSVYTIDLLTESFTGTAFPPAGWALSTDSACPWSRVEAGSNPTQAPYSAPAEAMFLSFEPDCYNQTRQLISPALDFSTDVEYSLNFWMYHDTWYSDPDRVQVQVSVDNGSTFENVGAEIYRHTGADNWTQHSVDLSAYAGQSSVRVVFKGISGDGSNIFLDDVRVLQRQPTAQPNCAISPAPQNEAENVILLANLSWANGGGVPTGYKLFFGIDNPPTGIVNGDDLGKTTSYNPAAIMAADTPHYWQVVPYNSFGDAQNCPVWSFTSGPAGINDFPYVEGFESGAGGWASGGVNSSWELGTPAGAVITGASSGANAWTTGLTTAYNLNEQSYVQSPAFDFSGLEHPYLKFDLWWDIDRNHDGANLQASLDGGANWDTIGEYGSDEGNWYQFAPTGLGFEHGWSGDSITDNEYDLYESGRGWRTAILDASDLSGEPFVLLRFYFGEGGADVKGDGFAFDNFEIRPGCTWTGALGDDWHTGNNWDCGHAPGAEEIVLIPLSTLKPVISEDTAASAVRAGAGLILNGGSLTTRYIYEYGVVYIADGNEVNLVGSGNAWEATRETLDSWTTQWGSATNGLVRFSGTGLQRIVHDHDSAFLPGERAQFYNMVIENGVQLQLGGNLQVVNDLTVNQGGTLDMGLNTLTVGNTLANNGMLRQKQEVDGTAGPISFLDAGGYGGLTLDPNGQNLGETSVQIRGNQECAAGAVQRCFQITPSTVPASGVGLTFYFAQAEIPAGSSCDAMEAYHWNGTAWEVLGRDAAYGVDGRDCTSEPFSIRVTGVTDFSDFVIADNQAPSVALADTITSLPENTNTTAAIQVADIVVTDDSLGTNVLSLSGADAALFEIVGTELRLKAGTVLDFETKPTLEVTVAVDDSSVGSTPDDSADLAINITNVNQAPSVALADTITNLPENTNTTAAIQVADIVVTDDSLGTNVLSLSGADAALFEIVGIELRLKAGTVLDFETKPTLEVTVVVDDSSVGSTPDGSADLAINITNVNEAPSVALADTITNLPENTNTAAAIKVADIVVTDDSLSTNILSLSGADAALFEIVGTELRLKAGTVLDFETKPTLEVTVAVDDSSVGSTPDDSADLAINITNVNEAPSVALADTITNLPENTNTAAAIQVADIVVTDDSLGTNVLSLSGADAAFFEIVGTELRLKAGTVLDFATNPTLDVTVAVDDSSVGSTPDGSADLAINITPGSGFGYYLPLVMQNSPAAQLGIPADAAWDLQRPGKEN